MTGRSGGIKNPFQDDGDNDVRHAKWKASIICSRYSKSRIQSRSVYNLTILSGTKRAEPLYTQKTFEGVMKLMMVKVMALSNQK